MTCYFPIEAFRLHGETKLSFSWPKGGNYLERLKVPCGQCIGCRLERSRQWAIRCVHEASLWEKNCFVTLTYSPENLPNPPSLDVRDWQLFAKRLRKRCGAGIRFFHCGEYGENFGRPHYHACLFNFSPPDLKLFKVVNGFNLYTSALLEDIWGLGFVTVGDVTFESAAYVARYIMKKVTGDLADDHYKRFDENGVVHFLKPEYTTMSRRPGIAQGWFSKFKTDVFPSDEVVLRGKQMRPPRYYDELYKREFPVDFEAVQHERYLNSKNYIDNNSEERLMVRHEVQLARLRKLPRNLE